MADDGHQVIASTVGDLIFARNVMAGSRVTQVLGQMSDESIQEIASSRLSDSTKVLKDQESIGYGNGGRFGEGRNLRS